MTIIKDYNLKMRGWKVIDRTSIAGKRVVVRSKMHQPVEEDDDDDLETVEDVVRSIDDLFDILGDVFTGEDLIVEEITNGSKEETSSEAYDRAMKGIK